MENTNCFANNGDTCSCLDVIECPANCGFFKTPEQFKGDKKQAQIHNVALGLVDNIGKPVGFMCRERYHELQAKYEKEGRL